MKPQAEFALTNQSEILQLLRDQGVALLRGVICEEALARIRKSATGLDFPEISYAIPLSALGDRAIVIPEDLLAPLAIDGLPGVLDAGMSEPVECRLAESWLRKRFAPRNAPRFYQPNSWHQDGGLGVTFTPDPTAIPEMTRLLTCWIPLQDCGKDSPGLELVRRPLERLLHYTELDDAILRQRFTPEEFWSPELGLGDGLLFLPGTLHRTHVHAEMQQDRLSLEYRFFPA